MPAKPCPEVIHLALLFQALHRHEARLQKVVQNFSAVTKD